MDAKQFYVLTRSKAMTNPPHDPDTCSVGQDKVIRISGYANFSREIGAGDIFTLVRELNGIKSTINVPRPDFDFLGGMTTLNLDRGNYG